MVLEDAEDRAIMAEHRNDPKLPKARARAIGPFTGEHIDQRRWSLRRDPIGA